MNRLSSSSSKNISDSLEDISNRVIGHVELVFEVVDERVASRQGLAQLSGLLNLLSRFHAR